MNKVNKKEIEWVIFDIGGVLINWRAGLTEVGKLVDLQPEEVMKIILDKVDDLDSGGLTPFDFWESVSLDLKTKVKPEVFEKVWLENHFSIDEVWDFASKLKREYKLGVLTNIWKGYRKVISENVNRGYSIFQKIYDSSEIGLRKPYPEIYKYVEKDLGVSGNKIFYIDDSEENLEVPKKLGWQTHLFDTNKVKEEIDELKILLLK